ncbi:MAG: YggS family pyridoxal phosphate-dependent enzyme, partial [Prosthecobacter sp.]|nr:YggS family pyridoxal phosphate-dependent enzyme [Prosthecobacter sp.]
IWHFTGPIQSNKAADIATHFDWVHSVDRLKIAALLSTHRPKDVPPLNVCIQVNLDHEASKSGVSAQDLPELALKVSSLPGLSLRGLMAIPAPSADEEAQYRGFLRLAHLQQQLNQDHHLALDTLSMGMSDDLIPAIRAGSTMVRIGRALFGERQ